MAGLLSTPLAARPQQSSLHAQRLGQRCSQAIGLLHRRGESPQVLRWNTPAQSIQGLGSAVTSIKLSHQLAQLLAKKGIRANAVAPGPIWTPLIPSTMPAEHVAKFGENTPMNRAGQPAELATAYVMLADPLSSYVSGATIAVTGGRPFL